MTHDAQTKKIMVDSKELYDTIIYFIERDSRSDKKYKVVGKNTIIVNNATATLLHEIGITFVDKDYSDYHIT
jgi:hypothetical protein